MGLSVRPGPRIADEGRLRDVEDVEPLRLRLREMCGALPVLRGRHPRVLFDDGTEGGFGVEARIQPDGQQRHVPVSRIGEAPLDLLDSVPVDEIIEAHPELRIDYLGEM